MSYKILFAILFLSRMNYSVRIDNLCTKDWYGPAHIAIDSYSRYYYKLPPSIHELEAFIKETIKSSSDSTSLYFGDARTLLDALLQDKGEYIYMKDSCYFHINGESGKLYSPDFMIRNRTLFHQQGRDISFSAVFFDSDNKRISCEQEVDLFMARIRSVREKFNYIVRFRKKKEICIILLEFDNGTIRPVSDYFDLDTIEGYSASKKKTLVFKENLEDSCKDYLNCLNVAVTQYQRENPKVSRIIFPAVLAL